MHLTAHKTGTIELGILVDGGRNKPRHSARFSRWCWLGRTNVSLTVTSDRLTVTSDRLTEALSVGCRAMQCRSVSAQRLPASVLIGLRVDVGVGLRAQRRVDAGDAAAGLVVAGGAIRGAAAGRDAQLSDGGLAAVRSGGLADGRLTASSARSRALGEARDEGQAGDDGASLLVGHSVGLRLAALAERVGEGLGAGGGGALVDAAVGRLAAGLGVLLQQGGTAERSLRVSLHHVGVGRARGNRRWERWDNWEPLVLGARQGAAGHGQQHER